MESTSYQSPVALFLIELDFKLFFFSQLAFKFPPVFFPSLDPKIHCSGFTFNPFATRWTFLTSRPDFRIWVKTVTGKSFPSTFIREQRQLVIHFASLLSTSTGPKLPSSTRTTCVRLHLLSINLSIYLSNYLFCYFLFSVYFLLPMTN